MTTVTTGAGLTHDCPWVGGCHCVQDGSLCTCSHQHGDHGEAPIEYDSACTQCTCPTFNREMDQTMNDATYQMPEIEQSALLVHNLSVAAAHLLAPAPEAAR